MSFLVIIITSDNAALCSCISRLLVSCPNCYPIISLNILEIFYDQLFLLLVIIKIIKMHIKTLSPYRMSTNNKDANKS